MMKNFKIFSPSPAENRQETVVLVHGLFERGFWMYPMARFLVRHGYTVAVYSYRTTRARLKDHAETFAVEVEKLLAAIPVGRIHFAGHSMGGLMIRRMLHLVQIPHNRRGIIYFMGVPHKGSPVANRVRKWLFFADSLVKVIPDLDSVPPDDHVYLPETPPLRFASAAAKWDEVVPPWSSSLPGAFSAGVFNTGHIGLIFHKDVYNRLLFSLNHE